MISFQGTPQGTYFFLAPPEKMLKSTVFELEQWFLHQNGPFLYQEFNGKGFWVLGSQLCAKKNEKNILSKIFLEKIFFQKYFSVHFLQFFFGPNAF